MAALYDRICENYDTTRKADPYIAERLASLLCVNGEEQYIDVACGTGNYTIELSKKGGEWCGIDNSGRMIEIAKRKNNEINWVKSEVENIPFPNGTFNGAVCTLAIHHFSNLYHAFSSIAKVMGNGRLVIFTALPDQLAGYWLNEYFPEAMKKSMEQLPSFERISDALSKSGFKVEKTEPFSITPELKDFFLYSGKHDPKMYLSKEVRDGISTFSNLASKEEISSGLSRLSRDIEEGNIHNVVAKYLNNNGDYLFVQAIKI